MNRASILIVENEPIIAMSLQAMIEDLGFFSSGIAGSGRAAIESVENKLPELVLMDISLDDEMDGIEVAEIMRGRYDVPVVFVTALRDSRLDSRVNECGAFGYVTKPFDQGSISNAIQLALLRHRLEKELRESEERFRIFAEYTCDWEYWIGPDGEAIYHSPSCQRITGYAAEEFMRRPELLGDIVHSEDVETVKEHIYEAFSNGPNNIDIDFRIINREGEVRWINHVCQSVYDDSGQYRGRRAGNRDITERKQLELKLAHMVIHDGLTGLPSRELLFDRLTQAMAAASRKSGRMAVLFLDLDGFKGINDSYGHRVGDLTLIEVARRLSKSIRLSDTVARLGGDEFVIVLSDVNESEDALILARKILQALGGTFVANNHKILIQASIGVALYPNHGDTPEELIGQADAAMYRAKLRGRHDMEMASSE